MTVPEQQPGDGTPGGGGAIPGGDTRVYGEESLGEEGGPRPGFGPPPQFGEAQQQQSQQQAQPPPQFGGGPQPGYGQVPPQFGAQAPGFGQQPYGQPGGYPPPPGYGYGYPPYGYPGEQHSGTNGMAIAAMVCGICGFLCLVPGLVGIILGIVSLPQVKARRQSGTGMAVTGIVMGGVWIGLFILLLILGHHGGDVNNGGVSTGPGTSV